MLHGIVANNELVSALGVRPEDEDAAIAQEWSPRGGRKQQNCEGHGHEIGRRSTVGDDSADREGNGDSSGRGRVVSPPTNVLSSSSRSLLRWRRQQVSRGAIGDRKGSRRRRSSTISPVAAHGENNFSRTEQALKRSLSHSPTRGRHCRRRGGPRGRSYSSDDDEESNRETYIFGIRGNSGEHENCIRSSTALSSNFSPGYTPTRGGSGYISVDSSYASGNVGNLGGQFELPNSPYRTYRAKLSRIARARSSERAAAETRRRRAQDEDSGARWRQRQTPRTRSTDADGRRIQRIRHGASGMTSPLLRREGFGLLESNVTGKMSLGMQLPRDQSGALGRARAAATAAAAEKKTESSQHPDEERASPLRLCSTARRERQQAHRRRAWLAVHHHGGSGADSASGRSEYNAAGDDFNIGERDERDRYPISRHFLEAGMPWPSARNNERPRSVEGRYGRGLFGSKRMLRGYGGNDRSSFSLSPPRTRTGTGSVDGFSTSCVVGILGAQQRGHSATGRRRGSGVAFETIRRWEYAGSDGGRSASKDLCLSSRSPSPLTAPLDPYRASRTVTRAGTLAARRDVVRVEWASRKAFFALQAASEARGQVERKAGGPPLSLNFGWSRRGCRRDGSMHRDSWDTGRAATVIDDAWVEEHRLKNMLPSVELMDRELAAIRRADEAMREEQLAQVCLDGSEKSPMMKSWFAVH